MLIFYTQYRDKLEKDLLFSYGDKITYNNNDMKIINTLTKAIKTDDFFTKYELYMSTNGILMGDKDIPKDNTHLCLNPQIEKYFDKLDKTEKERLVKYLLANKNAKVSYLLLRLTLKGSIPMETVFP
jgi:hypothetical protein